MSKRLITDRDVMTGAVRPPIVLDGDTLITPSARDRAVRLGWTIVESWQRMPAQPRRMPSGSEPGAAPVMASGRCSGDCARCGRAGCAGGCAGAAACDTSGSAAPALDALADGLYLVRIEGGRRVSVLPASGPGLMRSAAGPGTAD